MGKVLIPQDIVEAGKALLREHGHEVIVGSAFDVETMKREVMPIVMLFWLAQPLYC